MVGKGRAEGEWVSGLGVRLLGVDVWGVGRVCAGVETVGSAGISHLGRKRATSGDRVRAVAGIHATRWGGERWERAESHRGGDMRARWCDRELRRVRVAALRGGLVALLRNPRSSMVSVLQCARVSCTRAHCRFGVWRRLPPQHLGCKRRCRVVGGGRYHCTHCPSAGAPPRLSSAQSSVV